MRSRCDLHRAYSVVLVWDEAIRAILVGAGTIVEERSGRVNAYYRNFVDIIGIVL